MRTQSNARASDSLELPRSGQKSEKGRRQSRTSRFLGLTNLEAGAEVDAAMMPIGTALHEPVLTTGVDAWQVSFRLWR